MSSVNSRVQAPADLVQFLDTGCDPTAIPGFDLERLYVGWLLLRGLPRSDWKAVAEDFKAIVDEALHDWQRPVPIPDQEQLLLLWWSAQLLEDASLAVRLFPHLADCGWL